MVIIDACVNGITILAGFINVGTVSLDGLTTNCSKQHVKALFNELNSIHM